MSNTNTEVLATAYEKLQGALTQANTVLPDLEEAIEKGNLDNYATTSDLEQKAKQSEVNNIKNQVNNLVLNGDGTQNLEVVQARSSEGFAFKTLENRISNTEKMLKEGVFSIEFYDLVNSSINSTTGELVSSDIRITTASMYDLSALNEVKLRIIVSDKSPTWRLYKFDENGTLLPDEETIIKSSIYNTTYIEYIIDVSSIINARFMFLFSDDTAITEDDVYKNVMLYYDCDDRIADIENEMKNMCYDAIGNEFTSPSDLIKDVSSIVKLGKNVYDGSSTVSGYISDSTGQISTDVSGYLTSQHVKLQKGVTYTISPRIRKLLAYDKDGNSIASTYVGEAKTNYTFTFGNDWESIRFTTYESDTEIMIEKGSEATTYEPYKLLFGKNVSFNDYQQNEIVDINSVNILKDKIIFNFGDSIAAGDGNNGKGYAELFAEKYNMSCYDFAVGGATIGETDSNNITTQITNSLSQGITPDYILVNGGTNDINSPSVPLGTIASDYNYNNFDRTTTVGALEWIFYTLKTNFPSAKIAFISVHRMGSRNYDDQVERQGACVTVCKKWSVPVIDIFNRGNLNTFVNAHLIFTNGTDSYPEGDRTHPNELGYKTFYLPLIYECLSHI